MVESVHNLIAAAQQGDRDALANLTAQFEPCLKSVARTVPCDDSYEELRLFLFFSLSSQYSPFAPISVVYPTSV